jgi:hypothetical protein
LARNLAFSVNTRFDNSITYTLYFKLLDCVRFMPMDHPQGRFLNKITAN